MAYYLSPIGNSQRVSANGAPLSGGTITTFVAGTSTPVATYTDNAGGNPAVSLTLNTFGLPSSPVWLLGGQAVKFVIKDSLGNIISPTYDNVSGIDDPTAVFTAATANAARNALGGFPPVRQTVLSGPVDANGLPSFGGATGATTVTAAGTLVLNAASASDGRIGSIVNPSWTGLSTNGTMYLYLDIAADGTCTSGSTTLAPTYQWGGTYSVTNNQHTFNIQEMTMKVGNGVIASQVWRVFVGEVTVAAAVVSAITWYALMGRYDSGFTATLPAIGTQAVKSHGLGIVPEMFDFVIECTTVDASYAVGVRFKGSSIYSVDATGRQTIPVGANRLQVFATAGAVTAFAVSNATGTGAGITVANWKYKLIAQRGW